MGRKKTTFEESLAGNMGTYRQYYDRLLELTISRFKWDGLPDTCDARFLELTLATQGNAIFYVDPDLGALTLRCVATGDFNVYGIPTVRRAYGYSGFQSEPLGPHNSVIIYNNLLHTNSMLDARMFAKRLYNLDRTVDVNANAQKTPVLILCDEYNRLSMENIYKNYDGNAPVIFARKSLNPSDVTTLSTEAPYVADKIYALKLQLWNEALTYLGIINQPISKKERLISDEILSNQGATNGCRMSALEARKQACDEINRMFGLNISVEFRDPMQSQQDLDETADIPEREEGEDEQVHNGT